MNAQNQARASIIIVAYNAEETIERAIQSACDQTERNIEIICVDDGSTDSTYERICQYAARDARIKPVTQANSGTFGARYAGVQQVTSDYVLFIDADDALMPEAVETACTAAEETGADVLEFGTILVKDESNPPSEQTWAFLESYFSQQKPVPEADHGPALVNACFAEQAITWNHWNKCRRTELLRKAFRFYQGERVVREEDMLLTLMCLCQAERYVRIPAKLYVYTVGSGPSKTTKKLNSTVSIKNAATEGLSLKLAQEWTSKLGLAQEEFKSGMDALTASIRQCIIRNMLERVAEEKRGEYLGYLSQYCESNEYYDLISEAFSRQEKRIALLEEQNRGLNEMSGARVEQLERENASLRESLDLITDSTCWRMTKPIRVLMEILRWALRPHAMRGLLRRVLVSLRDYGVRGTLQKAKDRIKKDNAAAAIAKQELFNERQLAAQRERRFPREIKFSIVVPLYNTPERFLREMIESVQAQTYGDWELCMADGSDEEHAEVERICREYAQQDSRIRYRKLEKNLGISGNTNACLEMAQGDYIGLFDHDDLLHPAALHEVMRAICEKDADFIYTDESTFHETPKDAYLPNFKPAFAPDSLRGINYICHFTVFKRALLEEVGPFDPACDGSQDHDLMLRLTEKAAHVVHIPEILYYWRAHAGSVAESTGVKPYVVEAGVRAVTKQLERLGLEGTVEPARPGLPFYRVRYAIKGTPKISILIPNYEHMKELKTCLNSIFGKTTWPNYEIVIVENNSSSPKLFEYYEQLQREHANVRVVTWEGVFNYSAINNYGARFCSGEYLLLLNNDTEVITPDWLQEMLMFAQRSDVGAVGCMLYYPDDTIQHAGAILGIGGVAGHSHKLLKRNDYGYMSRLSYAQDLSAVTAACMLLRRDVWDRVKGLDEDWAVAFNDIDLCMRIRQAGYLIAWTPFAELYHYESKSRGSENTKEKRARFRSEVLRFQQRWAKELAAGDPYYNPNLTLEKEDFSVDPVVRQHDAR